MMFGSLTSILKRRSSLKKKEKRRHNIVDQGSKNDPYLPSARILSKGGGSIRSGEKSGFNVHQSGRGTLCHDPEGESLLALNQNTAQRRKRGKNRTGRERLEKKNDFFHGGSPRGLLHR
jgi:hypothetical protein